MKEDVYLATCRRLESDIAPIDASAFYASAAISLKRIADALGGQCAQKMLHYDIAHDAYFLFYPDGTRAIELVNVEPGLINKLLAAWEAAP